MAGVGLDLVDELKRQGYDTPTASQLARRGRTAGSRVRPGHRGAGIQVQGLREPRAHADHGVDPEFIASLESAGYKKLGSGRLVRVRDHGVDERYTRWSPRLHQLPGSRR